MCMRPRRCSSELSRPRLWCRGVTHGVDMQMVNLRHDGSYRCPEKETFHLDWLILQPGTTREAAPKAKPCDAPTRTTRTIRPRPASRARPYMMPVPCVQTSPPPQPASAVQSSPHGLQAQDPPISTQYAIEFAAPVSHRCPPLCSPATCIYLHLPSPNQHRPPRSRRHSLHIGRSSGRTT